MGKPRILIVDDQRDVLSTVRKDLAPLEDYVMLEECESAEEAKRLLEELDAGGETAAVIICDHIMPQKSGVELLTELNHDTRFQSMKKLLLTGLATHQDTITAINQASIDRYLEKPWDPEHMRHMVKQLLTQFLLRSGLDYQPYLPILDQETLFQEIKKTT
ncbi:MAG TPA: response regulator [bacterium]|nr:response regulator [Candidatus Omnitrophota bacterium]HOJ58819.1 response regulator [bacterium]HOL93363.1 response regulator [bacterium]HPO98981.1 response regulator [bacterium]HXK94127.1 response regulator [bacterium]